MWNYFFPSIKWSTTLLDLTGFEPANTTHFSTTAWLRYVLIVCVHVWVKNVFILLKRQLWRGISKDSCRVCIANSCFALQNSRAVNASMVSSIQVLDSLICMLNSFDLKFVCSKDDEGASKQSSRMAQRLHKPNCGSFVCFLRMFPCYWKFFGQYFNYITDIECLFGWKLFG